MDVPLRPSNVIEIDDDSDDGQDVRLEDFMTAEELESTLRRPLDVKSGSYTPGTHHDWNTLPPDDVPRPSPIPFVPCLEQVLEVFPDVSHDHVKVLYDKYSESGPLTSGPTLPEQLIAHILDGDRYPKEKDRLNELKRKHLTTQNSDDERAARWQTHERLRDGSLYSDQA